MTWWRMVLLLDNRWYLQTAFVLSWWTCNWQCLLGFWRPGRSINGIVVLRVHRLVHTDNLITWCPLSSYIQPLIIELQYQLLTSACMLIYVTNKYKESSLSFLYQWILHIDYSTQIFMRDMYLESQCSAFQKLDLKANVGLHVSLLGWNIWDSIFSRGIINLAKCRLEDFCS